MSATKSVMNVNGFTFCEEHGEEYCHLCTYDFRAGNNYYIIDELPDNLANKLDEERSFTFNAYRVGALHVATFQPDREPEFKCRKHGTTDCDVCFDWLELVTKALQALK